MKKLQLLLIFLLPLLAFYTPTERVTSHCLIKNANPCIGTYLYQFADYQPLVSTKYYISNAGNNSNPGTLASPWLTMSKMASALNAGTIVSGDSVFYNRGDLFSGSITINTAAPNNIYIGAYGTGVKPVFLYAGSGPTADSRFTIWMKGLSNYTLENLNFTDTNHVNDKATPAWCGFALYIGDSGSDSVFNSTIRNCDFSYVGMGIVFCGSFNTATLCTMTDFKNLNGGGAPSDYGATSFTVFGNDNVMSYNYITGAWAQSLAFGFNGNVVELYGDCARNQVLYNYCYDDGGMSEFGGTGSSLAKDNTYVGNLLIDCGAFAYATIGQVQLETFNVYQNVQVETANSRFSGPNCGHGLPDSATIPTINCDTRSFGYGGSPSASTVFNLKNNIFQLSSGMDVCQSGTGSKTTHDYNCTKLSNGSSYNVTPNTHDISTSATIFLNTTGNEATWDYHLSASSPCKGTGQTTSPWLVDKFGIPFTNNMGAFGPALPANTVVVPFYQSDGSGGWHKIIKVQ